MSGLDYGLCEMVEICQSIDIFIYVSYINIHPKKNEVLCNNVIPQDYTFCLIFKATQAGQ